MTNHLLPRRLTRRLSDQGGFTLIIAMIILTITMLLVGALFFTVQSDAGLTKDDLDGKRAYSAAQAGVQAFLYNLNDNSSASQWWQTCSNDTGSGTVPGNSNESYSYAPVITCTSGNAVGTVLDPMTGQLRIEFTGTSGTATRTIVAAFRTASPLSYVWYTVHETVDPIIGDSTCSRFYYQNPQPDSNCYINWVTGDHVYGPMYTQDQFLISGTPTLGGSGDTIASSAPTTSVCVGQSGNSVVTENCPANVIGGVQDADASTIPLATDNSNLATDASAHGVLLTGTTTLTITGSTATAVTCTTSTASACTTQSINLNTYPVIYAQNGAGCTTPTYTPSSVGVPPTTTGGYYYGPCGDIYLKASTYSASATIAAADDIIVMGDVLDSSTNPSTGAPTGTWTLGLVANQYVRVYHPTGGNCSSASDPNRTIDASILTLAHSFYVDNYSCGSTAGTLTVWGALAQEYRGIVGTSSGSGYLKNYHYDTRLAYLLPPYMFDLQDASWQIVRQTLCSPSAASTSPASCAYTGTTS